MFFKKKPKRFGYLIGIILLFTSSFFAVLPIDLLSKTDNEKWLYLYILDAIFIFIAACYWSMLIKDVYNDI